MLRSRLSLLCVTFLAGVLSFNAQAQETTTVVEKQVIVSPAPKAVCTTVAGHWEGSIWVDAHEVCRYENRAEGAAWIKDYWSCTAASSDGTCTNWVLVPGHWVKTIE